MNTDHPTSAHPFWVFYENGSKKRVEKFDSVEEAQSFINEKKEGYGYYMLGLWNFNTREFLPDNLGDDSIRRQILVDHVDENYPTESDRVKYERQNREAVRQVVKEYLSKFGIILLTILLAATCNFWLNIHINPVVGSCLAVLFFSGGTLGYLVDFKVKTFGGRTLAEAISENALIISYVIGTALTVLSLDFSGL